ncbi:MAG: hypothetical protein JSW00_03325 [Thermoplasmata archaeon]|nr:MAG: hypothetical protein JSW00_03325 [Thermoplasmata archaeon]
MKEFERLIRLWNLIKEGSVECELSQENEMLCVHITRDTVTIDIKDPKAVRLIWPIIINFIKPKMSTRDHIEERGSFILGILMSFRAKRKGISNYLSIIQGLAALLAENRKCVIIKQKGKQLAKLGYGADSMGMRLLNLKHIEVSDLSSLMEILEDSMLG